MISILSIVFMGIAFVCGFAIPAIMALVLKKKYNASLKPFFTGCVVFILFTTVEGIFHFIILSAGFWNVFQGSAWKFGLYGGFMAGIFEETGRYLAYKTFLKSDIKNKTLPFSYAAGHSGFEVFQILVVQMGLYLVLAIMLRGNFSEISIFAAMIDKLIETPSWMFLVSIVERLCAVGLHFCFSIIVWYGVKNFNPFYFPAAVILHGGVDAAVVMLKDIIHPLWLEFILICFLFAYGLITYGIHMFESQVKPDLTND